jgi:hypothetical protein
MMMYDDGASCAAQHRVQTHPCHGGPVSGHRRRLHITTSEYYLNDQHLWIPFIINDINGISITMICTNIQPDISSSSSSESSDDVLDTSRTASPVRCGCTGSLMLLRQSMGRWPTRPHLLHAPALATTVLPVSLADAADSIIILFQLLS